MKNIPVKHNGNIIGTATIDIDGYVSMSLGFQHKVLASAFVLDFGDENHPELSLDFKLARNQGVPK